MKRIAAREFLLFVACMAVVLLVALFGWMRNSWFEHRFASIGRELAEQREVEDSLSQRAVPKYLDFLDLFEPEYVRGNCDVFIVAPFWTMDPFWVLTNDEFEYGLDNPSPLSTLNRRYLMCVVKALDAQDYWSHDQLARLAMNCGQPPEKLTQLAEMLRSSVPERQATWRPPTDAAEIYNPSAPHAQMTTWREVLEQKGASKISIDSTLFHARRDTSHYIPLLIAVRGLLCESTPHTALRSAAEYLRERHALRCNTDDLLYTLQGKAAPPPQEAIDALTNQRATVDKLRTEQSNASASLWSAAKQWAIVKWAAIVLFVLVYPLRLLVLGTRWAVRTLRASE